MGNSMQTKSDELVPVCICGRGGTGRQIEFCENIAHVTSHRLLTDSKRVRDCLIGLAFRDKSDHLRFARRQRTGKHWGFIDQ